MYGVARYLPIAVNTAAEDSPPLESGTVTSPDDDSCRTGQQHPYW